MNLDAIINDEKTTIIDVRSVEEFAEGNVAGSVNIPLHEVPQRIDELKAMSKPLVLCCLSGGRSGQATQFLQQQGVEEVYNGGGWADVNALKK